MGSRFEHSTENYLHSVLKYFSNNLFKEKMIIYIFNITKVECKRARTLFFTDLFMFCVISKSIQLIAGRREKKHIQNTHIRKKNTDRPISLASN